MKSSTRPILIIVVLIMMAAVLVLFNRSQKYCITDLNNDRKTDSLDLNIVKSNYGKVYTEHLNNDNYMGDINKDGKVGADDLSLVIGNYNKKCEK